MEKIGWEERRKVVGEVVGGVGVGRSEMGAWE